MALAAAMPPQAHSMVSIPWTNAVRAESSRAADPSRVRHPDAGHHAALGRGRGRGGQALDIQGGCGRP